MMGPEKQQILAAQDARLHEEISRILVEFISQKIDKTQKDAKIAAAADRYKNRPEIAAWVNEITQAALSVQ
jgi:hypothetical protein